MFTLLKNRLQTITLTALLCACSMPTHLYTTEKTEAFETANETLQQKESTEHPWWGLVQTVAGSACILGATLIAAGSNIIKSNTTLTVKTKTTTITKDLLPHPKISIIGLGISGLLAFAGYKLWKKGWNSYFPNNQTTTTPDKLTTAGYAVSTLAFAHSSLTGFSIDPINLPISIFYAYVTYKLGQKTIENYQALQNKNEQPASTTDTKTA